MEEIIEKLKEDYKIWFMLDDGKDEDGYKIGTPEILMQKDKMEDGEPGPLKPYRMPKLILQYLENPKLEMKVGHPEKIKDFLEGKIIEYLETKSNYKNLSKEFSKVVKDVRFYATTYGLGTHIALNTEEEVRNKIKPVLEALDKGNIEYKLQYSEAMWVYKIVFSKSKENLKRLESLSKKGNNSPKM